MATTENEPLLRRPGNDRQQHEDSDPENPSTTTTTTTVSLYQLTQRVRCWLQVITWPIGPSFTILVIAWIYLVYATLFLNNQGNAYRNIPFANYWTQQEQDEEEEEPCSHPLHAYARISILLGLYAPYHTRVREYICTRFVLQRQRHTPTTVLRVTKRFDQVVHTIALLYVYAGISIISTCRQDHLSIDDNNTTTTTTTFSVTDRVSGFIESIRSKQQQQQSTDNTDDQQPFPLIVLNTCQATCPVLTQAMYIYVATLEIFTLSIILPLLILPCLYLWFLRQATTQQIMEQLQQRLVDTDIIDDDNDDDDPEDMADDRTNHPSRLARLTADEVLQRLQTVKLIRIVVEDDEKRDKDNNEGKGKEEEDDEEDKILVVPIDDENDIDETQLWENIKKAKQGMCSNSVPINRDCCVCMSEFQISKVGTKKNIDDVEIGVTLYNDPKPTETIVRTPKCHHLFHKKCIATWVGGRWENTTGSNGAPSNNLHDESDEHLPERLISNNRFAVRRNSWDVIIPWYPNSTSSRDIPVRNYYDEPAPWVESPTSNNRPRIYSGPDDWGWFNDTTPRRLPKRTTCPLCRADLRECHSERNSNDTAGVGRSFDTPYGSINIMIHE